MATAIFGNPQLYADDQIIWGKATGVGVITKGDWVQISGGFLVGLNKDASPAYKLSGAGVALDNNPVYDFQVYDERLAMGNSPIASSQSKGKVIARIPLLGNFKLFISPPVLLGSAVQAGCDSHYTGPVLARQN